MTEQLKHTILLLLIIIILILGIVSLFVGTVSKINYTTDLDIDEEPDPKITKTNDTLIVTGIVVIIFGFILGCILKL